MNRLFGIFVKAIIIIVITVILLSLFNHFFLGNESLFIGR